MTMNDDRDRLDALLAGHSPQRRRQLAAAWAAQPPSRVWRGRFGDGSEILVTAWPHADGREVLDVAVRRPGERVWGPPTRLVEEP